MNILLINHYAGSPKMGMEYRPYYLAQEWLKAGHSVTILAADYSHLRTKNPSVKDDFTKEMIDGIHYMWIKTPPYKGNGLGRIKNMFKFIVSGFKYVNHIINDVKPDVVIASSTYPSDNYLAKKIAKKAHAKYVFEVHDLWPLSPMQLGEMSKYHPFIMLMQHGENFAYKNADKVISMLPKTKEHMKSHGLDLNKWHYIPNGIVVDDWAKNSEGEKPYKQLFDQLKAENKFIVGYAGGHSVSNALEYIVEASNLLSNNHQIAFVFVGNGIEKDHLKSISQNKNLYFLEAISKTAVPQFLKQCDALILSWHQSPLYKYGISPNKIFDYMMASKPIIHAVDAGNDHVKEAKAGLSVKPENPTLIAEAILSLKSLSKAELNQMGLNGRDFVLKNHDYKILANTFIDVIS